MLLFAPMNPVTAVIMHGPAGSGDFERMLASVRAAAVADSLEVLRRIPVVERVILAGPESELTRLLIPPAAGPVFDPDRAGDPFHFGARLSGIVQRHRLSRVLYLGAGSMPLLSESDLSTILRQISESPHRLAITNNIHAADWAAFTQAGSIADIAHWLDRDNLLAWRLRESAGYDVVSLPPSAATRLDIDTPFDLQALAFCAYTPGHIRRALGRIAPTLDLARVEAALQVLRAPGSRLTLVGRVSGTAAERLASKAQCWSRVFSEERGMVSSRRWAEGQVFSLLADHIDRVGEKAFVAQLEQVSDLILWDTRVYLAHHKCWPAAEERFASDLCQPGPIADDRLKRLTQAVADARVPFLLGGHNVVSGGLYVLSEMLEGNSPRPGYQP